MLTAVMKFVESYLIYHEYTNLTL